MSKAAHITTLSLLTVISFVHLVRSQAPSPCPEIFSYEPRGQEQDRWYGVLSLQSREELNGIWLHVSLDRPAELLGNWFGEATSSDNQDFAIKNPKYKLEAGPPVSVRFFVKYNAASTVPSLTSVRLNGKTICTSKKDETTVHTPQLHISQHVRPSNQPATATSSNNGDNTNHNQRPTNTRRPSPSTSSQTDIYGGNSRPSTINYGNTDDDDDSVSFGSSFNQNQGSHNNQNQNQNQQRRPSGGSSSNLGNNHRGQQQSSGSTSSSNGLSVESEDTSTQGGSDYFPGDFAVHNRPQTQVRPGSSRPTSLNKRSVGCGTVAMRASPLISHGQNTTQGQWPWHVALYHSQGIQLMYTCGATLISESHVVTAAHCVTKPQTNRAINPQNLLAYLGKHNLKKFGSEVQDREVSDIYVHPQYNYSVYFNDIAILKLGRPVDVTNYVRPCCLWEGGTDLDDIENNLGTVVGWGFDENRRLSNSLMMAQMPVVSTVKCIYSNREFFSQFTFEKNYCAGFKNGTSVCNGDSGGGMVFPKKSGRETVWQIRGLVSVGVALQGQGVCDPSQYIVFTDVAKHLDWIKRVMDN